MSQSLAAILAALALLAGLVGGGPIRPPTVTPPRPTATVTRQLAPGAFATPKPAQTPAPRPTPDNWIPERPPRPCPFPACFGPDDLRR